jgi:hypothetical protein
MTVTERFNNDVHNLLDTHKKMSLSFLMDELRRIGWTKLADKYDIMIGLRKDGFTVTREERGSRSVCYISK